MSVQLRYEEQSLVAVGDIKTLVDKAVELFDAELVYRNGEVQRGYFDPLELPDINRYSEHVNLSDIHVCSHLDLKADPWESFILAISSSLKEFADLCRIHISIGYGGLHRRASKRSYEMIFAHVYADKKHFQFDAGGAEYENHVATYREMFHKLGAPFKVAENEFGYFVLEQQQDETPVPGYTIYNPNQIKWDLSELGLPGVMDKMRQYLQYYATDKRFQYSYSISPVLESRRQDPNPGHDKLDLQKRIYDWLRKTELPAVRYEVQLAYTLNEIDAIDALKGLCGSDDVTFTHLCQFQLPNGDYAKLDVITNSEGHRLALELKDIDSIDLVNPRLKTSFAETEESKKQ